MPQKYEREIDEILRRMDAFLPSRPSTPPHRRLWWRLRGWVSGRSPRLGVRATPSSLMVAGLVIALTGYVLGRLAPSLSAPLSILALALFVGALALSIARNRRRRPAGWRGRPLDYQTGGGLIWAGWLRRWREWRRARRRGPWT